MSDEKSSTQSFHQLVSQTKHKITLKLNIKCIFVEIQNSHCILIVDARKTRATSLDVSSVFTIAVSLLKPKNTLKTAHHPN